MRKTATLESQRTLSLLGQGMRLSMMTLGYTGERHGSYTTGPLRRTSAEKSQACTAGYPEAEEKVERDHPEQRDIHLNQRNCRRGGL